MNIMGRGNDGAPDRVLNAPTNEAWIDPWVELCASSGVRFDVGHDGRRARGRGAAGSPRRARPRRARAGAGRSRPTGSSARCPPSARASSGRATCSRRDPRSSDGRAVRRLDERHPVLPAPPRRHHPRPHHLHRRAVGADRADPGAVLGDRDFPRDYGDGTVVDCLSVDISDWDTPGILYGKPAKQCTRDEIAREVWAQIKAHLDDTGDEVLPDDILHSWFLDPAIAWSRAAGATATTSRCSSTRSASGRSGRRRAPGSRTCSSPATTCRPTSTWRRWRARTSPAARRSTRCSRRPGSKADAARDVQALRPARVRGGQAGRRRAATRPGQPNALDHHP